MFLYALGSIALTRELGGDFKRLQIFLNQFLADKDIPWQFQISSLFEQKIEEKHFMCTNKAIELLDNFYEGHKKIMALLP